MLVRHLISLMLSATVAHTVFAQEVPVDDQEPRVRIQIDVTATVPDDEHWIEIQTKNFLVAGTADEEAIRKVASDLELLRDIFAQFNPRARAISSIPTTVIVFGNSASFRWYSPADTGQLGNATKGYVRSDVDKNYIVMTQGSVPADIYRGYVRLLIPEAMGPVPLWLREGLSDYFSTLSVNRFLLGDKRWSRLGTEIPGYDSLLDKKVKLLSLTALSKLHEESPEYLNPESRKLFLAQSWGVVHYIMSRPGGLDSMQQVFNSLLAGASLENGIRQTFGKNADLFEEDFKRYIRNSQREHQWGGSIQVLSKSESQVSKGECGRILLPTLIVRRAPQCYWEVDDFQDPPGVSRIPYSFDTTWAEVHALKVRKLEEAEAWFYRGDLMLHIGRFGEAEAYLRRAIQQSPNASKPHASMGLLHLQQKRYADAASSLELALEIDPDNYLAHYYNAVLPRSRGLQASATLSYDDLEDIREKLLRVISLAPQFTEAREMLATINLSRRTGIEESKKVLLEGMKRYPGRISSWVTLARVAAAGNDSPGARWLLTSILAAGAPDAASRKAAISLLDGLESGTARTMITGSITPAAQTGGVLAASVAPPSTRNATRTSGETLRGVLTNIECKKGLTLSVQAGGKTVRLHAPSAFSVDFIARDREGRATASEPIICGPVPEQGIDVSVTYRPVRSGDSIGEPLLVEIRVED